jgi:PAS domain S-box-containing protein
MGDKIMENTRYNILLIEDDKLDQMAFTRLVEDQELPYDCKIAGSVSEARSILGREGFDIILTDYSLGDGTAFDILDLVKNTPIIVVTGAGSEETALKAWRVGAYDYLAKDVERNYLKAVPITIENAVKHKRTEEKLRLLSKAILSTDDNVYISDMENKITFVNRVFCETYGYSEEDIIGKDGDILWKENPESDSEKKTYRAVSGWEVGFFHKRKDGSEFPVSLSRSVIKDENGNDAAVVLIAHDISERIQVENELRTANLQLEKQNQLKDKFAITVCRQLMTLAAEFKNVISDAVTGALGKISPELQENLEHAGKGMKRFESIVSEYLDISQLDAGKVKLDLAELNLRSLIIDVVRALSPLADERHIELKSLMPDSELVIEADRNRIIQALYNIINNSIESIPSNGHITVRAEDIGNEIMVKVEDDSPAIESSRIAKSFNRFTQIRMKMQPGSEGQSALGLPIARELLEMHGRSVWIESGDSQGNCVCFTLPKSAVQEVAYVARPSWP